MDSMKLAKSPRVVAGIACLFSTMVLASGCVGTGAPLARLVVEAGDHHRSNTPVSITLTDGTIDLSGDGFHLVESSGSERSVLPVQIERGAPTRLWFILPGETQAGTTREFELHSGWARSESSVEVVKDDKTLLIKQGDASVLSYHHAIMPPPAGESKLYERSAFIHPIWSPSGSVLTNIHPKDHYHHMGLWMPWTKTRFEGKGVDFWNLDRGQGTVRFNRVLSQTSGPVFGGFQVEHDHVALQTASGEKLVLKEVWDVRVYNVGGPNKGDWICDFVSTQRCVAETPLLLEKYRYGGFGFRGAAEWKGDKAAYLTSEGKTRVDGHATRARWCDTAGVSDGQWKGITHFSHPQNIRHPEAMRIWPGVEQHVFFNWAPIQLDDLSLDPGQDYVFRYRMIIHEGKVDVTRTERLWNSYAHPPVVTISVPQARVRSPVNYTY